MDKEKKKSLTPKKLIVKSIKHKKEETTAALEEPKKEYEGLKK